jgi:peptidoglycan/xylan/chitin deacetylase (PgdA/CDA1 family)
MALPRSRLALYLSMFSAACATPALSPSGSTAAQLAPALSVPRIAATPGLTGLPRLSPPGGAQGSGSRRVGASKVEAAPAQRSMQQALVEAEETRANVLLYHAFDRGRDPLSVSSQRFERQLIWLIENDVEIVALSELVEFLEGRRLLPKRVAVITIDDGVKSVHQKAWPILKRHGIRFTLGLPTYYMQTPENAPMLSWDEVREMLDSGLCEIASHGHRHRALPVLSKRLAAEELELSAEIITEQVGARPFAYFYPLGALDAASMKSVLRAGYRAAFSAIGGPIAIGSSPLMRIPRTSIFHDDDLGMLAYYFSERFFERLPETPRAPAEPLVTASARDPLLDRE